MRIGVLTHSAGDDNYGQILQCYALQQYLKRRGHHPFLIQFDPNKESEKKAMVPFWGLIRFLLRLFSPHYNKAYVEVKAFKKQREINSIRNKVRKFKQFKSDNIELSKYYVSYEELLADPPKADAYIVGSDQVWNQSVNSKTALAWYLQFGAKETKRVSYAASIGRKLDESEYKQFHRFLEGFTAVSVREANALECCEKAGVSKVKLVLDPTLLVTKDVYKPFIHKEKVGKPYLFLYYLNVIHKEDLAWNQIEVFLREKNLQLQCVGSSGYYPVFDIIPGYENSLLTIPEWLNAVYYSEYVVTTSFHGIAISIMMHRPFVAILLKGMYSGGNGRITSLLSSLGLSDRILTADKTISDILKMQIDWTSVDKLLAEQRERSEQFLQEALKI
jgi:hypothetical protein